MYEALIDVQRKELSDLVAKLDRKAFDDFTQLARVRSFTIK